VNTQENLPPSSSAESAQERLPQFNITGFELLNAQKQKLFLNIPPNYIEASKPTIEREIQSARERLKTKDALIGEKGVGVNKFTSAKLREDKATFAIETFHRAEQGDPQAQKDLSDHKKEVLGEKNSDEEIFKTILENESSDPFKQDMVLETMLSDREAKTSQKVFDLFKGYRGDLASVDDALPASEQLDLFLVLSKGQGSLNRRFDFVETVLDFVTKEGTVNLFEALKGFNLLKEGHLIKPRLEEIVKNWQRNIQSL